MKANEAGSSSKQRTLVELHRVAWLALGTFAGVLTRFALELAYDSTSDAPTYVLFHDAYVNVLGCLSIGLLQPQLAPALRFLQFNEQVYDGLASGFCGSFTTFSSWQYSASLQLTKYFVLVQSLNTQLFGYCTSYLALLLGEHISGAVREFVVARRQVRVPSAELTPIPAVEVPLATAEKEHEVAVARCLTPRARMLVTCTMCIVVLLLMAMFATFAYSFPAVRVLMIACDFGVFGTLLRYYTSLLNVRWCKTFPLFTFLANVIGSALLAVINIAFIYNASNNISDLKVLLSPALQDNPSAYMVGAFGVGFCGCLTTVSTFVAQAQKLPVGYAYFYVLSTIIVAQLLQLAVNGPLFGFG